jgi:hypothetical protein
MEPTKAVSSGTPQEKYDEFANRFKGKTDDEVVAAFNREVGNNGWTSSRASFMAALHDEIKARGFDFSAVGDAESLSFRAKVRLNGKVIELLDPSVTSGPAVIRVPRRKRP